MYVHVQHKVSISDLTFDIRCSYLKLKSCRNIHIVYKWVKCTVNVVSQCPGEGGGEGDGGEKSGASIFILHICFICLTLPLGLHV